MSKDASRTSFSLPTFMHPKLQARWRTPDLNQNESLPINFNSFANDIPTQVQALEHFTENLLRKLVGGQISTSHPGTGTWDAGRVVEETKATSSTDLSEVGVEEEGSITTSAYDTAWVAMVRQPEDFERLAFPESLEWLLREQAADGSWGGTLPNSLLPTLAALLALVKAPVQTLQVQGAISQALLYLQKIFNLKDFSIERHESVGFEVIGPALLQELEKHGICFEFPGKARLVALSEHKLTIAPVELLYSGDSNLIHSLEAFGSRLDFSRLKGLQTPAGSYGCSPSATASVLLHSPEWDNQAANWLNRLSRRRFMGEWNTGGVPTVYPIDVFERAWTLHNLALVPYLVRRPERQTWMPLLQVLLGWLRGHLSSSAGIAMSSDRGVPLDSDDTGVVLTALNQWGVATPVDSLFRFEREKHFACYQTERGISISANAHVLAALNSVPSNREVSIASTLSEPGRVGAKAANSSGKAFGPSVTKLVNFLYEMRQPEGFWTDKWHISPYYATACAALALATHSTPSVRRELASSVTWLLQTQCLEDGGWGIGGNMNNSTSRMYSVTQTNSSLEETAYALQVLCALRQVPELSEITSKPFYQQAIERGSAYLWEHVTLLSKPAHNLPRLWRGKELYTPLRVVESAVISALWLSLPGQS